MIDNHSVLGLHMAGNNAEIDSLGFLVPQEKINIAIQNLWTRLPDPKFIASKKMVEYNAANKCWICEGWRQIKFTWVNTDESLTDPGITLSVII